MQGKLNAQQLLFLQEYLISLNATEAAKKAGYSKKTAYSQGQRLLKHVEIQRRLAESAKKKEIALDMSKMDVLRELSSIATANIKDVCSWDEEGRLSFKPSEDLPPEISRNISEIQVIRKYDKEGDGYTERQKIKFHDKIKALEMLAKHFGVFQENQVTQFNFTTLSRSEVIAIGTEALNFLKEKEKQR